jgi:hypothetical protein
MGTSPPTKSVDVVDLARRRRGRRSARARARSENRFVVEEKKKRRRRKRLEGDAFASVAAREEVPGYLGGGVEVSEHDGC